MAEKQRQAYIDSILEYKFAGDDSDNTRDRVFLESLSLEELKDLNDEIILETENS